MAQSLRTLLSSLLKIPDSDLRNELRVDDVETWDSLKHMELVVMLEQGFSIELDIDDITKIQSIGAVFEVMRNKGVDC